MIIKCENISFIDPANSKPQYKTLLILVKGIIGLKSVIDFETLDNIIKAN